MKATEHGDLKALLGALLLGIDLNSLDVESLLGPLARRAYS